MATTPRQKKRRHAAPAVPKNFREAEKITEQMYRSLTSEGAPRATPMGYVMGASMVLKMLIDQAVQQGEDRDALKAQAMTYIQSM